jgi:hypothetical protein
LQLPVLRFRSDEDRNVRVGVFPQREEILIRRLGFGGVALLRVGASEAEMRECTDRQVLHNSPMVENFLEFNCCFAALMRGYYFQNGGTEEDFQKAVADAIYPVQKLTAAMLRAKRLGWMYAS